MLYFRQTKGRVVRKKKKAIVVLRSSEKEKSNEKNVDERNKTCDVVITGGDTGILCSYY
jgi:NAD kinase